MRQDLLNKVHNNLNKLPPAVQQKVGQLVAEARTTKTKGLVKNDFMAFVN